jgi:hypothetical protein
MLTQAKWRTLAWRKGTKGQSLAKVSPRHIRFAMASACPYAREWLLAAARLALARGSAAPLPIVRCRTHWCRGVVAYWGAGQSDSRSLREATS